MVNYFLDYSQQSFLNENFKLIEQINESLATAKKRFLDTKKLSNYFFTQLVEYDPSPKKKYLEKMCEFAVEIDSHGGFLSDYMDDIKKEIIIFDNTINKNLTKNKDIQKFKNYEEFKNEIIQLKDKVSKSESKELIKKNEATVIRDDDFLLIIAPKTKAASCLYGAGTKWCITMKTHGHWEDYYEKNAVTFYFIIAKKLEEKNPLHKVAVAVYPSGMLEVYDAKDDRISNFEEVFKIIGINAAQASQTFKPNFDIERLFKRCIFGDYVVKPDGTVNIAGNVAFDEKDMAEGIPFPIGHLNGALRINGGQLNEFKNFPQQITNHLIIKKVDMQNGLKGVTQIVGGDFVIKDCEGVSSTKGFPKEVTGDIYIDHGIFKKFEDLPKKANNNLIITTSIIDSLEGLPDVIYGNLLLQENELTTDFTNNEKFFPKKVHGILNVPKHWFKELDKDPEKIKDYLITICEVNRNDIIISLQNF